MKYFIKTFNRRQLYFNVLAVVFIILFGLLAIFVRQNPHNALDLYITLSIQKFHPTWFNFLMHFITFIGNNLNAAICTVIVVVVLWIKKFTKEATMTIISTLGTTGISIFFKQFIHRARPDPHLIHQIGTFAKDDSFPSGHVLFYVGLFGFLLFLSYTLPKGNKYRLVLFILFSLLILLVGPSRIFLGAHWFTDTLGSYLIGFAWLIVLITIYTRWVNKKII